MAALEEELLARVDVTGSARVRYEAAYFEWLLASLADAVRQVMLAPRDAFTFDRRRGHVLALLDTIEEVQRDSLALLALRLEPDELPHDRGAAGIGRPAAT